jgi:SAM-dependent methyltransferase
MSDYSQEFYADLDAGAASSAERIVPMLMEMVDPPSVFDFGCGLGQWLGAFKRAGVPDVHGLDGPWVDPHRLVISPSEFTGFDFSAEVPPELPRGSYDLATTFEVLEHLDEGAGESAVRLLSGLSNVLVVSAAIPDQGGTDHINEQWPAYWYEQFKVQGYECFDCIRHQVWDDPQVEWWYAQNILVYARGPAEARVSSYSKGVGGRSGPPAHLVHPSHYTAKLTEISNLRASLAAANAGSNRSLLRKAAGRVKRAWS